MPVLHHSAPARGVFAEASGSLQPNMRRAIELSFSKCSTKCFYGRLLSSSEEPAWLTYGQVATRLRPVGLIVDVLAADVETRASSVAVSGRRPFVAISGPNSLEWLLCDWASSGLFVPSVGLHPEWDAEKLYRVLKSTKAGVIACTSVDMAPRLAPALQRLAAEGKSCVRHLLVLDPVLLGAPETPAAAAAATLDSARPALAEAGVSIWAPQPAAAAERAALGPEEVGTIPAAALLELASRVVEACADAVPWAREHLASVVAAGPGDRLFPEPSQEWLAAAADAEEAAQAAAAAAAVAEAASRGPEAAAAAAAAPKGLYHPLASAAAVKAASERSAASAAGVGAAGWLAAAAGGDPEARLDVCGLWTVMYATGSSGILKGVPTSRAAWASSNGVGGDGKVAAAVERSVVLSHSALSHGLDRGFSWKAMAIGGAIGVVPDHDHASLLRAVTVFRPGAFCTMPSFWTRLYLDAVEEAAASLRRGLLGLADSKDAAAGSASAAAASPVEQERAAVVEALVADQMRGLTDLLRATAGVPDPRAAASGAGAGAAGASSSSSSADGIEFARRPSGLLDNAWLARPAGSLVHALQAAAQALSAATNQPDGRLVMASGGAPLGWQVLAFLNQVVYNSNFYDVFGATEAAGIGRGNNGWLEVDLKDCIRLSPEGREGDSIGQLEAAMPGAAVRYFGADEGDEEAAAATRAAFTPDGWWVSGDKVQLRSDASGGVSLRVLGRMSDRIELYIGGDSAFSRLASEIERCFTGCPAVHAGQLIVDGNRDDAVVAAVAVPSADWLRRALPAAMGRPLTAGEGASESAIRACLTSQLPSVQAAVAAAMLAELRSHGAREGVEELWLPSGLVLDPQPWSRAAGTLGVVAKPVRREVLRLHRHRLYEEYEQVKKRAEGKGGAGAALHHSGDGGAGAPPAKETAAAPPAAAVTANAASPMVSSPVKLAAEAAAAAVASLAQGADASTALHKARKAAWASLVSHLAHARSIVNGSSHAQPSVAECATADAAAAAAVEPLLAVADAAEAVALPWLGLLADLWHLVRQEEPLLGLAAKVAAIKSSSAAVGVGAGVGAGAGASAAATGDSGSTTVALQPIVYGRGCHKRKWKSEDLRPVPLDVTALTGALTTPALLPPLPGSNTRLCLRVVPLEATLPPPPPPGEAENPTAVEYTGGHLVVACLAVAGAEPERTAAGAVDGAASGGAGAAAAAVPAAAVDAPTLTLSAAERERLLVCIRRAAAAFDIPRAARPIALITLPPGCAADSTAATAACTAAACGYAESLSLAMLPSSNKSAAAMYAWKVPPLPTAAEADVLAKAVEAVLAAGRELWHRLMTEGDPAARREAREMMQAAVDEAIAAAEAAVTRAGELAQAAQEAATAAAEATAARDGTTSAVRAAAAEEAANALRRFITGPLRQAQTAVANAALDQSQMASMAAAELPLVNAARVAARAAVACMRAVAGSTGVELAWQMETAVEYQPPAEDGAAPAVARDGAEMQFNLAPPIDCAITGRPLLHGGIREEDAPLRAVSMESGRSISLTAFASATAVARAAAALQKAATAASAGSATASRLAAAAESAASAARALDSDLAEEGMWAAERAWPWKMRWPFSWYNAPPTAAAAAADGAAAGGAGSAPAAVAAPPSGSVPAGWTTQTPTPAAWVHHALLTWGHRPCVGTPLELAASCSFATLPSASGSSCELPEDDTAAAGTTDSSASDRSKVPDLYLPFRISRGYAWLSYAQLLPVVRSLACNVRGLPGVNRGDLWGICAPNCPEWLASDFAAALAGMCPVGFHITYTPAELADTVGRTQPAVAVVAPALLASLLALCRAGFAPGLRAIIVCSRQEHLAADAAAAEAGVAAAAAQLPPLPAELAAPSSAGAGASSPFPLLLSFERMASATCEYGATPAGLAAAKEDPINQTPGRPDGLFTLLFTSGSSGRPKGVMVSPHTWRRDIGDGPGASKSVWPCVTPSFIPLSHSSDRIRCWETLGRGGRIGFCHYAAENWVEHQTGKKDRAVDEASLVSSSNGVETLLLHLAALRPTAVALPPRIWNGLRFLAQLADHETGTDGKASSSGTASVSVHEQALRLLRSSPNLDAALGGRVAVIATGGAAPNKEVMAWARLQFPGRTYAESYGATECGAITSNGLPMPAHSGRALQLRLDPLSPERGGEAFPPPRYGEMVVKTPTMALGYWHDAEATAAAFTPDGWFRTGDICEVRRDGSFAVIDRVGALARVPKAAAAAGADADTGFAVVSPAAIEAALAKAAAAFDAAVDAARPRGWRLEHLCLVPSAAAGASLVAAVSAVSDHDGGAGAEGVTLELSSEAALAWLRAAGTSAGLQPWELPAAVYVFPAERWTSAPGGLLNVQHKVVRGRVAEAVAAAATSAARP